MWPLTALNGLTAVAYERVDFRDVTMAAAPVAYALGALGADAGAALERAATRSDPGTATVLRRFRDRAPRSLASWGYAVVDEGRNISLVRSDLEP